MSEMRPEDVPADLMTVAFKAYLDDPAFADYYATWNKLYPVLAAVLPLHRQQIAAEVEAHAQSIGWYEGGGVWAEAIDVIKQEPRTRREDADA